MFRIFKIMVELFWIMDVLDMPFMEMFDTTYPLNGLFWFFAMIMLGVEEAFETEKGDK